MYSPIRVFKNVVYYNICSPVKTVLSSPSPLLNGPLFFLIPRLFVSAGPPTLAIKRSPGPHALCPGRTRSVRITHNIMCSRRFS